MMDRAVANGTAPKLADSQPFTKAYPVAIPAVQTPPTGSSVKSLTPISDSHDELLLSPIVKSAQPDMAHITVAKPSDGTSP